VSPRHAVPFLPLLALTLGFGPALAAQSRAFVLTSDVSNGSLSVVNLDTRACTPDVQPAGADAFERWFDGNLYIVNRFGGDNIQVVDGTTLNTIHQWSTGNGSNPQDICFVTPTKAYVTRYASADLLILNPQDGTSPGTISLAQFADADGLPEMAHMIRVDKYVFVALQRLNENAGFTPTDSSLVAVIDAVADTVVDTDPLLPGKQAIRLERKNPFTEFQFDRETSRLLIGCTGAFGALDGGVEWIDPVHFRSLGTAISESELGGDVNGIVWHGPTHSYAIINDLSFNTSVVSWDPSTGHKIAAVYAPGGYSVPYMALDDRGELYVCNNSSTDPGLHVFSAGPDVHLAGPIDTGLPPAAVAFDSRSDEILAVAPSSAGLALSAPAPNPALHGTRLSFSAPRAGDARVEVLDVSGRRVRLLFSGRADAGMHELSWDLHDDGGRAVSAGVYLVRARLGGETVSRRLSVVR